MFYITPTVENMLDQMTVNDNNYLDKIHASDTLKHTEPSGCHDNVTP